jgi:hypothetical protein
MQEANGTGERYRIKALPVATPDEAKLQASGKLRTLVGVLGLGAVLLFIVVSVVDAFAALRVEQTRRTALAARNGWHAGEAPQDVTHHADEPSVR